MSKPKITLITATYYRPDLLARAIKSVQTSTFKEYEHVIVSDHCPKAAQVYDLFKEDKRIRFFEQEPPHIVNHGARTHNYVIEHKAESDFFCFLGDDNIVLPNMLEVMYNALAAGDCDGVFTKTYMLPIIKGDGGVKSIISRKLEHDIEPHKYVLDDIEVGKWHRDIGNFAHNRKLFERTGPQPLSVNCPGGIEDCAYFNTVDSRGGTIKNLDAVTGIYYGRSAHAIRDEDYHNKVIALKKDEIFVYPEILKKAGVL